MKVQYKSYLTLAGATALAQAFVLLVSPIVTRIYTPETFGGFGLVFAIGVVVGAIGTGRLEHAIPVTRSQLQAVRVFALGVMLIAVSAAILSVAVLALGRSGVLIDTVWAGLPLLAIPPMAVGVALFQLTSAVLLRQRSYGRVGANKILQGFSTGTLQILLGLLSSAPLSLLLAQTIGYLSGCLSGISRLVRRLIVAGARQGFALRDTFRRFRKFPLLSAPAALFNHLSQHLPVVAIGYAYGLHEAGMYALILRVCGAPSALIGQAVAQVYAGDIRELLGKSSGALTVHYRNLLARMFGVGIPVVGAIAAVIKIGDQILFGSQWAGLGDVAICLFAKLLMDFTTAPVAMTLVYLEKQGLQLYWDIGRLCAVLMVFAFVSYANIRFYHALTLFSLVWALGQLVHVYVTYRACQVFGRHQALT